MHFARLANTLLKDEESARLRFDGIMVMSLWRRFFRRPVYHYGCDTARCTGPSAAAETSSE